MVNKAVITTSIVTMVSFIMSIIAMFVGFLFLPLLNGTGSNITNSSGATVGKANTAGFMTTEARTLLTDVYPVLMILIPLFVLIAGLVVIFVVVKKGGKGKT